MTVESMAAACQRVINAGCRDVALIVPGGPPTDERIRLDRDTRGPCPVGEVLSWTEHGTVAAFDALDVVAWLTISGVVVAWMAVNGAIEIKVTP